MNATSSYTADHPRNVAGTVIAFGHGDYATAFTQVLTAAPTPFTGRRSRGVVGLSRVPV